jgi:hypothetical protein
MRTEPTTEQRIKWASFVKWLQMNDDGRLRNNLAKALSVDTATFRSWFYIRPTYVGKRNLIVPDADTVKSVLLKAMQIGWTYGAEIKLAYSYDRLESLILWMKAESERNRGFQLRMARELGVSPTVVCRWVAAKRRPLNIGKTEEWALANGWVPAIKAVVLSSEQLKAAKDAEDKIAERAQELEERAILAKLKAKYPDAANGQSES